jgi:hypothetical protein
MTVLIDMVGVGLGSLPPFRPGDRRLEVAGRPDGGGSRWSGDDIYGIAGDARRWRWGWF